MHGRLKVRTTAEQQEAKQRERAKKLAAYRAGMNQVFDKRKKGELDEEILKVTSLLLLANPDIYTLWNVRKETLLHLRETRKEEIDDFVKAELVLTEQCIQVNPKSYNAWFQRSWVLDLSEKIDWQRELSLCDKCLSLDDRNFHCWDYRRVVVKKSGTSLEEEYKFSSNKIEANFSNYSSWHYRSELLPRIFPDPAGLKKLADDKFREECTLIQNAVFTDPGDQSAWFYHRWLLFAGKAGEDTVGVPRFALLQDGILLLGFTKPVSSSQINIEIHAGAEQVKCPWSNTSSESFSSLWFTKLDEGIRKIKLLPEDVELHEGVLHSFGGKELSADDDFAKTLEAELDSCRQLQGLEPDNKWVLLRMCEILRALDISSHYTEIMEYVEKLKGIDPLRTGFYTDWRSNFAVEYALQQSAGSSELVLRNCGLTCLSNDPHIAAYKKIDLSGNAIRHLDAVESFFFCEELMLDNNKLSTLKEFGCLPRLLRLSVKENEIRDVNEVFDLLRQCKQLKEFHFSGNICYLDHAESVRNEFPHVKIP